MPDLDTVTEAEAQEAARLWTQAIREALDQSTDTHGLDPDLLLDLDTDEGVTFVESLDPLVEADIDDPSFARAVEAAALLYATEHPELRVTETAETESIQGRVLEAKGTDPAGGRVFRVQIIKAGTSRNSNRYTESVLRDAAHLYEGAKAYDHHRDPAELRSSTLQGLVGSYRNVKAEPDGLYGDLHLLPSAAHTAEALDRAIHNQTKGLPPLVGISHDVMANFRPATSVNGKRVREAVAITAVQSADVVADPSAGGKAIHAVESTITEESEVPVTKTDVLAAISQASDDELAAVGLHRAGTTESAHPTYPERVVESRTTEAGTHTKTSFVGRMMIRDKAEQANVPVKVLESVLADAFTEADVDGWIANHKASLAPYERAGLEPRNVQVTRESRDKVTEGLDKFFAGDFSVFRSFKQAHAAYTGHRPRLWGEDENRVVFRESFTPGYDSWGRDVEGRVTESLDSSSWAQVLGDSVTRRLLKMYRRDDLNTWRKIAKSVPVNDFRTQRLGRTGGYGTLSTVAEGGPYQPLTSPGDEEATFALSKKGGTEDVTLEMVANDDVRSISRIPGLLGRAAVRTLYEAVFGILSGNPTATYDSVALFHSTHANTDTSAALTQTTLGVGRRKMIEQAAYGDSSEILGTIPKYLIVPPELEELAFQLTRSAVAIPATPAGPSDAPNIHNASGLEYILVPSFTDANDWFISSDPDDLCNIEVGFYQGREEPELFTQANENVGSMFNNDSTTWKIRHIWKEVVVDHRGLYRGVG